MMVTGQQSGVPAVFMRGGTSNALIFKESDLPDDRKLRNAFFLAVMGSPDPNGRQLDGMGGGISSLSKVCIVGPSDREDADVDYTFAQVSVTEALVDYGGNCGNMSSAIGPFAVNQGLVDVQGDGLARVRILNTNTNKIIHATFPVLGGLAEVKGETSIMGVSGTGAAIDLDFLEPGGTRGRGVLPAGDAITRLELDNGAVYEVSLVDCANPHVFVSASSLGLTGLETPQELDANITAMDDLEQLRQRGSIAMGLTPTLSKAAGLQVVPKVAVVAPARDYSTLAGEMLTKDKYDFSVRMIAMGRCHRAIPLTGGLSAAAAVQIPGSLVHAHGSRSRSSDIIRIGTPSGVLEVDAKVTLDSADEPHVAKASVRRTARTLMQGIVFAPS